MEKITTQTDSGAKNPLPSIDLRPNICPLCHNGMQPQLVGAYEITGNDARIEIVFRCVIQSCRRIFIAEYRRPVASDQFVALMMAVTPLWYLKDLAPLDIRPVAFPQAVAEISPGFVEIYNQASHAEAMKLNQIAGIGYRKAMEFLLKDFIIGTKPGDADFAAKIKRTALGNCISEFIDDPKLKTTASRAVWLGNDETHYVRKWKDKDMSDLKVLLKLSVNWVESHLLTRQYEKEMPGKT